MTIKTVPVFVFATLAMALLCAPMRADTLSQLRVTIPFAFLAGGTAMPAGEYTINQENGAGLIAIEGAKASAMMVTHAGQQAKENTLPALDFERSDRGLVLKEIRFLGTPSSVLPEGRKNR